MEHPTAPAAPGIRLQRRHDPAGPIVLAPSPHHRLVLHLSAATSTVCRDNGQGFLRTRGDVDILAAHDRGGFDALAACSSLEALVAPQLLARVAREHELPDAATAPGTCHMLRDRRLEHLLLALDADLHSDLPQGALLRESIEVSLASALLLRGTAGRPQDAQVPARALQRVLDYIEAHLDRPLTLARLAQVAGISRSGLQRAFRQAQGMAVHQYVVTRRVERARSLLLLGRDSPAEVALMAGFAHQSHMARWMRRVLQATPGELRAHAGMPKDAAPAPQP